MEIASIWIEKFRSLENLNFNFSNDFEFTYDPESNNLLQRLKSDPSTAGFYGSTIANLSAIIGENGVGKTSLLHCIQTIYNDLKESFTFKKDPRKKSNLRYLVVFKTSDKFQFFLNGITAKINTDLKPFLNSKNELNSLFLVYYANFFEYSSLPQSDHTLNLSTNSLIDYILSNLINKAEETGDFSSTGNFQYIFKTKEIISQLEFLSAFDTHIPFRMPSQLSVVVRYEVPRQAYLEGEDKKRWEDRIADDDEKKEKLPEEERNWYKAVDITTKLLLALEHDLSTGKVKPKAELKRLIQQAILINFFEDAVYEKNIVVNLNTLSFDLSKIISHQKIAKSKNADDLFLYALQKVSEYRRIKLDPHEILEWVETFVRFTVENGQFITEKDQFNLELSSVNSGKFKSLIKQLAEFPFSPILDFYWSGISSGENALITIFSRIYQLRNILNVEGNTVIYMLDECEINFHPEWQRKFIKIFSSLLSEMFFKTRHQLILSSHSPLMLSDIPKSDVIFLEKKDSRIVVSHLSERKQTFAANIHTLLSDAFFMKEGTIGELAKEKINWVIDQINSRYEVFEQNLEEIKKIIDLIGEPVIRTKLAAMINEKMGINLHNIDVRLKKIESRRKK